MALLIACLFLSATAQCTTLCAQAERPANQDMPPCHQHAAVCTKTPLTAERVMHSAMPVPTAVLLPADFIPVVRLVDYHCFLLAPPVSTCTTAVLLI